MQGHNFPIKTFSEINDDKFEIGVIHKRIKKVFVPRLFCMTKSWGPTGLCIGQRRGLPKPRPHRHRTFKTLYWLSRQPMEIQRNHLAIKGMGTCDMKFR